MSNWQSACYLFYFPHISFFYYVHSYHFIFHWWWFQFFFPKLSHMSAPLFPPKTRLCVYSFDLMPPYLCQSVYLCLWSLINWHFHRPMAQCLAGIHNWPLVKGMSCCYWPHVSLWKICGLSDNTGSSQSTQLGKIHRIPTHRPTMVKL